MHGPRLRAVPRHPHETVHTQRAFTLQLRSCLAALQRRPLLGILLPATDRRSVPTLCSAKENIRALEYLRGYIVSGCWELKREFRSAQGVIDAANLRQDNGSETAIGSSMQEAGLNIIRYASNELGCSSNSYDAGCFCSCEDHAKARCIGGQQSGDGAASSSQDHDGGHF